MFVVLLGSILTTVLAIAALAGGDQRSAGRGSSSRSPLWLWLTLLFANFAEAVAEGRGKAQADALRATRRDVQARRLIGRSREQGFDRVPASALRRDDVVFVEANETIPADGEVIDGVASVDESSITGESAPVVRESGSDFSSVTGGTRVLSDWLVVRVTSNPGESFLDRMIALVEGARRQRTPNEIALSILLAVLTLIFLFATATLAPFSAFAVASAGQGTVVSLVVLVALLVCLIPTTIGALLSAIGIAGMDRMVRANVIATSGRAVEAAGDVDVLLLDKTGTITLGDRQATDFHPAPGVSDRELADAAQLASLADETPEGRSIVVLAKQKFQLRGRDLAGLPHTFHKFSAQTRMSGVDLEGRPLRKGAADAIRKFIETQDGRWPAAISTTVDDVARRGATPLVVSDGGRVLGVIELQDIVKGGIRDRFAQLRRMGIRTVMVTGDNRLTAAAIAAEAGSRRLSRRSDARSQADPDPQAAVRGPPGRHVRRRHERCPCARAGRRRGRDELRHPGGQGSRQHGRSRLEPHEADRGGRGRQADAGDARRADHVLDRQRRRKVLRDHPGGVRHHLPVARGAQPDAPREPGQRHPVRRHLQRADHRGAGAARTEGRRDPRHVRRGAAASQPADLRRRRDHRALHRDQAHRPAAGLAGPCLRNPCSRSFVPRSSSLPCSPC